MEKSNGNQELLKVRNEIDTIDEELLVLFIKRLECAKKVAEIKKEHSLPVLNSGREQEILNKMTEVSLVLHELRINKSTL